MWLPQEKSTGFVLTFIFSEHLSHGTWKIASDQKILHPANQLLSQVATDFNYEVLSYISPLIDFNGFCSSSEMMQPRDVIEGRILRNLVAIFFLLHLKQSISVGQK